MKIRMKVFLVSCLMFTALTLGAESKGIGLELGLSYAPSEYVRTAQSLQIENMFPDIDLGPFTDHLPGAHAGYSFLWLLHVSWDSLVMPPWWIYEATSGLPNGGVYAPGSLHMFDAGFRLKLWFIYFLAEAGINGIYLHSSVLERADINNQYFDYKYNLQLGAGLKFESLGVALKAVKFLDTPDAIIAELAGFGRIRSKEDILDILSDYLPFIIVNLHFN